MTIWTLDQIHKAQRLEDRKYVACELIDKARFDVVQLIKQEIANGIVREATTFGVDAHVDDVYVIDVPDVAHNARVFHARWSPRTEKVQFIGGPGDGTEWQHPNARDGRRIWFPGPTQVNYYPVPSELDAVSASYEVVEYHRTGWHEQRRCWVYTPVEVTS